MLEKRILLVGGGSGGHIYPLIAVAESLRERASSLGIDLKLMLLGDGDFIKKAGKEKNIPVKIISAGKLRRYPSPATIVDLFKIPLGFIQSLWHIFWFMPDAIFTKGGYASVPPAIVARIYLIPVFIHESDSVPGLANSILGKIAKKVFISFKTAEKYFEGTDVIFTGNPVRRSLLSGNKEEAWKFFDFHEQRPTILVLGGSQGAKVINDVISSSLVVMSEKYNIIHQCGQSQYDSVKTEVDTILKEGTRQYADPVRRHYRLYPFFDENQLGMAYVACDIIVSRAGAGAIFEIAQMGKPSIIVPISQSAANHQYLNAFEFSLNGAYLMEEKNLNRESLLREIELMLNPENYAKIKEKMSIFATPYAADKIAEEIISTL